MNSSSQIFIICGLLSAHLLGFAQDATIKPLQYPAGYSVQPDLFYTKINNWEGKLDLYLPPKSSKPTPVVVKIHGGGWNKGNKSSQSGFGSFFKRGYAVANITITIHGDADLLVPYQQSVMLKAKYDQYQVKSEFITVKGGLHGKFTKEDNNIVNTKIMVFLTSLGL